ncbi:MAG: phage portal protein [Bacilli bacterium]|nr:phage portal protein [Bacilli bacterium]
MGLFSKKKTETENRGLTAEHDVFINSPYNLGLSFNDLVRSRNAMSISAVYRCTELISDSVAMLPIRVKDGNTVITNHSLYKVFDNRENLITKYNLIKLLIQSVLLRGNGFAYIERNGDGSVKSLRYLESGDVSIVYEKQRNTLYYQCPIITTKRIEPINMIHLRKNTYDGINGISVISYADATLRITKASEASSENFYSKGGNLSGVLTVQGQLSAQQRQDIISNWNTAYSGGGQGIAVLQGNMNYQPIQVNAHDAQLIEARQYNVRDIARFFGVAPSMLGDNTGASYGSVEAEQQAFTLHTLQPYIVMLESEFSKKLLKGSEANFKIDLDETYLLKADKNATANYYTAMVNNGILTRNEARLELGFEPVEGGDKLIMAYTKVKDNTINGDNNETKD